MNSRWASPGSYCVFSATRSNPPPHLRWTLGAPRESLSSANKLQETREEKSEPEAAGRGRKVVNPELGNGCAQQHASQYQAYDAQGYPYIRIGCFRTLRLRLAIRPICRSHADSRHRHVSEFRPNNKAIALAWNGFNVYGLVRGIPQRLSQPVRPCGDVSFVIDTCLRRPQPQPQLLP